MDESIGGKDSYECATRGTGSCPFLLYGGWQQELLQNWNERDRPEDIIRLQAEVFILIFYGDGEEILMQNIVRCKNII